MRFAIAWHFANVAVHRPIAGGAGRRRSVLVRLPFCGDFASTSGELCLWWRWLYRRAVRIYSRL